MLATTPLRGATTLIVGAALGLVAPAHAAAQPARADCGRAKVAAHRGVHDARHTENTVRSARLAVVTGADVLEGDMRQTRDGVWVMMHDSSVARTTNGRGQVARLTYAQIRRLTTDDGVRGGIPTVDAELAVLDAHPAMSVQFEIKPSRVSPAALRRLLGVFARHHLARRLTITSFHAAPLAGIRRISPVWRTSFLTMRRVDVNRLRRLGQGVSIEKAALTPAYAAALHRQGMDISVWTVDTRADWDRVVRLGVDSLVTNRAVALERWCAGSSA